MLSVSTTLYNENERLIKSLKKGDGINFSGALVGQGTEFKMHHLHAKSISKNDSFMELSEIVVRESALP